LAQVSKGWAEAGTVEVDSQRSYAYAALWTSTVHIIGWLSLVGLIAAWISRIAVQQIRRPLLAMAAQATALTERRFVAIGEPSVPELRRVAQALNAMVTRVRAMFTEQVEQIEHLRKLANCDARTGLADRQHFMQRLQDELVRDDGGGRGLLVLMRVQNLGLANQKVGHAGTDAMLLAAAQFMEQPVDGQVPLMAGRLNGSDFAVLFDHAALAQGVANTLIMRVQQAFARFEDAGVVASVVEWHQGDATGALMQNADAALARAELRGNGSYEFVASVASAAERVAIGGEESWRRSLEQALERQQLTLGSYPLVNQQGHLLHQECPLRVCLLDDGSFSPAAVWLPVAVRTGMIAQIDLAAATLALAAIEEDGTYRGINVALGSLQDTGFVPALRTLVEEHHEAAARLCIDIDETALAGGLAALGELCRQLRPFGVAIGVEHAGERAAQAPGLLALGLDYVKLRGSFVAGVAGSAAQAALVRGTLAAFHGLGLKVYAEGVQSSADLQALWDCGVDGVTGPVLDAART